MENLVYFRGVAVGIEVAGRTQWFPGAPLEALVPTVSGSPRDGAYRTHSDGESEGHQVTAPHVRAAELRGIAFDTLDPRFSTDGLELFASERNAPVQHAGHVGSPSQKG